ncbi:MAG: hypothetical protein EOM25_10670 [Deltaproteobacteria bacterium]|nr:hypothetical protein [Deltaproteobacteria bacterium]
MKIDIRTEGLKPLTIALSEAGGKFERAKVSALKSTGWMIRGEIRAAYEALPQSTHGLSRMFRENKGKQWTKRGKEPGMSWFGRFVRYAAAPDGNEAMITLGRSGKGQNAYGKMDHGLASMADKHEKGRSFAVTDKMRRKFAATKRAAGWRPGRRMPKHGGWEYFALRKSTGSINVPARPVWGPVRQNISGPAAKWFEEKFYGALRRYGVLS